MSLELKNYTISIDGEDIIKDVSLLIPDGELHVIMGPNGAGKSTLANALSGQPECIEAGSVRVNNTEILPMSPDERAKLGLFVSFQKEIPIPGLTYVQFLRAAYAAKTGQKQNPISFFNHIKTLSNKHDIDIELLKKFVGDTVSGGEAKKLELLQIHLLHPNCIILDEIDAGLDVANIKQLTEEIRSYITDDRVGLIITHHTEIASMYKPDKVHLLQHGCIHKSGGVELIEQVKTHGYE